MNLVRFQATNRRRRKNYVAGGKERAHGNVEENLLWLRACLGGEVLFQSQRWVGCSICAKSFLPEKRACRSGKTRRTIYTKYQNTCIYIYMVVALPGRNIPASRGSSWMLTNTLAPDPFLFLTWFLFDTHQVVWAQQVQDAFVFNDIWWLKAREKRTSCENRGVGQFYHLRLFHTSRQLSRVVAEPCLPVDANIWIPSKHCTCGHGQAWESRTNSRERWQCAVVTALASIAWPRSEVKSHSPEHYDNAKYTKSIKQFTSLSGLI